MTYQSRDGVRGHSDSYAKLERIRLPVDLSGKSFLDIGCNEGFFCGEALRRGAKRVVGIEVLSDVAKSAQQLNPQAEILNQTWETLPAEKFDVIIMLSALHYEPCPRDLMNRIYDRLAPGGLFILECGVNQAPGYSWTQVSRAVGTVVYPTETLLREHVLDNFAVRMVGPSVNQTGDAMPRFVFHCTRRVTTYIFASGPSHSGKTNLAYSFAKKGTVTVIGDMLLIEQRQSKRPMDDSALAAYFEKLEIPEGIKKWVDGIRDKNMAERLARYIYSALPKEPDIVFVEGYMFDNPIFVEQLNIIIKRQGLRAWMMSRTA